MHPSLLASLLGPDGLIIIVVIVVVLLFGGNKLPKLARGLGAASHEFRKGIEEGDAEAKKGEAAKSDSKKTPEPEDRDAKE